MAILGLVGGTIACLQLFAPIPQQSRNLWTFALTGVAFLLLMVWLLALSRLRWRVRLMALAVIVLLHAVVIGSVRIKGVSGNLVPILEWRWASTAVLEPVASHTLSDATQAIDGWPQFLGPNRDCAIEGPALDQDWEANPPEELWRIKVGLGWSGFAVAQGRALTQEQIGGEEAITCYDASNGHLLWRHKYPARYSTTIAGVGPRATPTVDGDLVFAVGSTGWLHCLSLETGEVVWSHQVLDENGGKVPPWGYSVSPLIWRDLVIQSVGGSEERSLVAYDKASGELKWNGGTSGVSYSSPILMDLGGLEQVVVFNHDSVVGHDPVDGRVLWQHPYATGHVHVAAPLALPGDRVLISSGYGHGSELFQIKQTGGEGWEALRIWKSTRLKAKFTNLVFHDGHVYGLDDGIMTCIELERGRRQWKDGRYGHGQMILVGDLLILTAENGEVVLIDPSPDELIELGRFRVFSEKTWNPPALAGSRLFLRNDQEAACVGLPVAR